jgi:hypothetical protein
VIGFQDGLAHYSEYHCLVGSDIEQHQTKFRRKTPGKPTTKKESQNRRTSHTPPLIAAVELDDSCGAPLAAVVASLATAQQDSGASTHWGPTAINQLPDGDEEILRMTGSGLFDTLTGTASGSGWFVFKMPRSQADQLTPRRSVEPAQCPAGLLASFSAKPFPEVSQCTHQFRPFWASDRRI